MAGAEAGKPAQHGALCSVLPSSPADLVDDERLGHADGEHESREPKGLPLAPSGLQGGKQLLQDDRPRQHQQVMDELEQAREGKGLAEAPPEGLQQLAVGVLRVHRGLVNRFELVVYPASLIQLGNVPQILMLQRLGPCMRETEGTFGSSRDCAGVEVRALTSRAGSVR